ncbi:MAG: CARDB domain-containing protein, partial [Nanoarchaeota archaeon]
MRFGYFVIFFLILALSVDADWNTYENDLRNSASSDGKGYFPLKTANFSNNDFGTDFQPLISDLDNDGKNEIVIFSNNSLIIFNPQLEIKFQAKIGSILGQPTLFDFNGTRNIIFNSRQSLDYFFAYKINNSKLVQNFNITLNNESNFSGIKCVNLNETAICVFKNKKNYVNVIELISRNYSIYNTSVYNETRQTVPAIGDIHNDGRYEAVWWFNEDNSNGYGFLVFDLSSRRLDTDFNNRGIIDNIFSPLILGDSLYFQLFTLKGQPVLVDLNNDNKLEIAASVFYDDSRNNDGSDWFTELFVYSHNGTKLFSKCDAPTAINSRCDDGSGEKSKWEGTNPFVLDYDKNAIDDICFVKDVKNKIGAIAFSHMALNCYNYSGDEIAKVNLSSFPDGVKETAMAADMNDDGSKEIVTSTHIYLLNGASIFDYNLGKYHPIAVDLDGNKGLDLIWSKDGQIKTFLDSNNYTMDLSVSASDINFFKYNSTHINVTAIIKNNGQMQADNAKVIIYNTETLDNNTAIFNIARNANATFSSILPLKDKEKILVSADYDNEISESDENNNYAYKTFLGLPYVFVSTVLEPSNIESEFKDYIKNNLVSGYYTDNGNEADVLVYIGKNNPRNMDMNVNFMNQHNIGYDYGNINYNDKIYSNP